ncbi:hypothetical protein SDRG_16818 [Saprolegnia diclina VS20]|uniref:Uncharacterized protein n=1 Tax=Saprolegnia diclina (strain VS20) TaxID=1156394 RepID=T0R015_SAPDV|nr:hypothetical protein SDRG_16818 [Saprolegnia diclina VS20]EQC25323.1 hypothetical protein SDRG_16818 [Saprolegnia diclina VS20]|eukprot:XP_008621261.1 hypothetical protein SDRG_16818 [Saprolegnia diclina VS20]
MAEPADTMGLLEQTTADPRKHGGRSWSTHGLCCVRSMQGVCCGWSTHGGSCASMQLVAKGLQLLERSRVLHLAALGLRPRPQHLPKPRDGLLLHTYIPQIRILGTDALRNDPMVVHPIVLVHLVDVSTGCYLMKFDRQRPGVHALEPVTMLQGALKKHTMCDYILPIATQPCPLSPNGQDNPTWNELLLVNDAYSHYLRPETLLLFEVVDFTPQTSLLPGNASYYTVAWGFCRPQSPLGSYNIPLASDETTTHRIQLYEYQPTSWLIDTQTKRMRPDANAPPQPPVYFQYLRYRRQSYPCTLHVSFGMQPEPPWTQVEHRAMFAHEQEVGEREDDVPLQELDKKHVLQAKSSGHLPIASVRDSFSMSAEHLMAFPSVHCKRYPSEFCLVPERILHRLHSGDGGCQSVAFSHAGSHLAAACCDRHGEYPIRLYHIDTGVQEAVLLGHQALVYAITWSLDDEHLLSASSDGSAKHWQVSPPALLHSFYHPLPNFVYCVEWCSDSLGATGALDGFVRLWDLGQGRPIANLHPAHTSRVNAIRFEPKSQRLFSGDAAGIICVWQPKGASFELVKTLKHHDLMGKCITSFQLHPKRSQLLVQAQPNTLLQFELRSYLVLNKGYSGLTVTSAMVKSAFSPDGRFVASGSEDGAVYLYSSLNGRRIPSSMWGGIFYGDPLCDVTWSSSAHIAALCSLGSGNPIIVLGARRDDLPTKDSAVADEEKNDQQHLQRRQKRLAEHVATLLAQDGRQPLVPEKA